MLGHHAGVLGHHARVHATVHHAWVHAIAHVGAQVLPFLGLLPFLSAGEFVILAYLGAFALATALFVRLVGCGRLGEARSGLLLNSLRQEVGKLLQ